MQDTKIAHEDAQRTRIARRLRTLREKSDLTQEGLATCMGLRHRQSLTSIEAGERAISPEELVRAAECLGVEMDLFTDPYRLVGEGRFSFRADQVPEEAIRSFEDRAGRWVATYRTLLEHAGIPRSRIGHRLELEKQSSFEEAHVAADQLRHHWNLGNVPATTLPAAIERELNAQVWNVDAPPGVSGAAVYLPSLLTILVNRREPTGRRNFDLAHELFHLLTWDSMPPERVEPVTPIRRKGNRVERLADNFAGALLLPADVVAAEWGRRGDTEIHDWLNTTATKLKVTSVALKWRLVVLGFLTKAKANEIDDTRLGLNGGLDKPTTPLRFSQEFIRRISAAMDIGRLSLRRALNLLDMAEPEFGELCRAYGVEVSYEV